MNLDDLCAEFESLPFPHSTEGSHPERETVGRARAAVGRAVVDDEFLIDCVSHELQRLQNLHLGGGLDPFFDLPGRGIRFAFGYWPPGSTAMPHEHTAWTITAVCRNALEVLTFDREQSYRKKRLVPKNQFSAVAGMTGFIYEPCIHEPRNTSAEWSLSLHVTSPREGEKATPFEDCFSRLSSGASYRMPLADDPYSFAVMLRRRQQFVHLLTSMVAKTDAPETKAVLAGCLALASTETRRLIQETKPGLRKQDSFESDWILARTHNDLVMSCRSAGENMAGLYVQTANGEQSDLAVDEFAREALTFVTKKSTFAVHELPGNFSEQERAAIGEALESTGLFRRVQEV